MFTRPIPGSDRGENPDTPGTELHPLFAPSSNSNINRRTNQENISQRQHKPRRGVRNLTQLFLAHPERVIPNQRESPQETDHELGLDDLDLNPRIKPAAGTSDSLPPANIVYTRSFIKQNRDSFDMCHYFNNRVHVYTIVHSQRKRNRFSEPTVVSLPPLPQESETALRTRMSILCEKIDQVSRVQRVINPLMIPANTRFSEIQQEFACKVPNFTPVYVYNAQESNQFACMPLKLLKEWGYKKDFVEPIKNMYNSAFGRCLKDNENVYPICSNRDCYKISHLEVISRKNYLARHSCIGKIYCMDSVDGKGNVLWSCDCDCDIECKKCYFITLGNDPIATVTDPRLPFNIPTRTTPTDAYFDRDNKNVAMRFSVEEAKELFQKYCKIGYIQCELGVADNEKVREETDALLREIELEARKWTSCSTIRDTQYVHKQNDKGFKYLEIPKNDALSTVAKRIKVKDLVWRANGHSIADGKKVFNLCARIDCVADEHLVEETKDEHYTRLQCSNILIFDDNNRPNVSINCKHEPKCRKIKVIK